MKKITVIETLDSFEDEFETEKLIERLLLVEKIEKGIQQADKGITVNFEIVKQRFHTRWSQQ